MTLRDAIAEAAARLTTTSDTPRLDAELLAAHALGIPRETLLLGRHDDVAPPLFDGLIARRADGEPVAYILGERDFWTITLRVAPGVLIPRPDSETLIEAAVQHFGERSPASILDLGTGSGALLLAALHQWPRAKGVGVDRSEIAVEIAHANALRLGLADRSRIILGDWADGLDTRFDLMLCNPPYIEASAKLPRDVADYEPANALYAGPDGLDAYRRIIPEVSRLLSPGGIALFEIGATQGGAVSELVISAGHAPRTLQDLAGCDRCVVIDGPVI